MSNDYLSYIRWVRETQGLEAAHKAACERIVQDNTLLDSEFNSQFLERHKRDNGAYFFRQRSEKYIGSHFDMADCHDPDDDRAFFWVDPATGQMHPVAVGCLERAEVGDFEEMPFIYGGSDLIANGQVVGRVDYTDH